MSKKKKEGVKKKEKRRDREHVQRENKKIKREKDPGGFTSRERESIKNLLLFNVNKSDLLFRLKFNKW